MRDTCTTALEPQLAAEYTHDETYVWHYQYFYCAVKAIAAAKFADLRIQLYLHIWHWTH